MAIAEAGEELAALLLRSGVGGLDSALAAGAADIEPLATGQRIFLRLGSALPGGARSLEGIELRIAPRKWIVIRRAGDDFIASREVREVDDTPLRLRLAAGPQLAARLGAYGLPASLRQEIVAIAGDAHAGTVEVMVAHEESASGVEFGPLLFLSLTADGAHPRRWFRGPQGDLVPIGTEPSPGQLLRPVSGPISSSPGLRFHPILRMLRWHKGTDFAAPAGTPVKAAQAGEVVSAGWSGGYGQLVRLRHPDGSVTSYAHLRSIAVTEGDMVQGGMIVGEVGATGLATGPHLHFELMRDGRTMEPHFAAATSAQPPLSLASREALKALIAGPYREPRRVRSSES